MFHSPATHSLVQTWPVCWAWWQNSLYSSTCWPQYVTAVTKFTDIHNSFKNKIDQQPYILFKLNCKKKLSKTTSLPVTHLCGCTKDVCIPTCLHSSDPSIKPKPTAEVDPTVFEKRFLKKVRDLGEVRPSATHAFYFFFCTSVLAVNENKISIFIYYGKLVTVNLYRKFLKYEK